MKGISHGLGGNDSDVVIVCPKFEKWWIHHGLGALTMISLNSHGVREKDWRRHGLVATLPTSLHSVKIWGEKTDVSKFRKQWLCLTLSFLKIWSIQGTFIMHTLDLKMSSALRHFPHTSIWMRFRYHNAFPGIRRRRWHLNGDATEMPKNKSLHSR